MTDKELIEILDNHIDLSIDSLENMNYGEREAKTLSAMREAVQRGIDEYVVTQKGHVFNIWEIEQRRKLLEACRLDSIGFANFLNRKALAYGDKEFIYLIDGMPTYTTDQLYNEYLKTL